jgi:hypothetical protein
MNQRYIRSLQEAEMECLESIKNEKEGLKIKTSQLATPEGKKPTRKICEIKDTGI